GDQPRARHVPAPLLPPTGSHRSRCAGDRCATGQHLAMLRDRGGWRVTGVEFSPRAAALARRVHSLNVHTGDLLSAHLPAESVDLVLMKYVLEHVPDPLGELREIRRVLRPGGRAVFWVPNL
ncbi:MAG: class I SAM-dependent methyltransferase, partial [Armatimonadetes bacterium]|nr:class I SAM-dependent methyltransferase [Armatimonadota bacterium]